MTLTDEQEERVRLITDVASVAAVLGCIFLLLTFALLYIQRRQRKNVKLAALAQAQRAATKEADGDDHDDLVDGDGDATSPPSSPSPSPSPSPSSPPSSFPSPSYPARIIHIHHSSQQITPTHQPRELEHGDNEYVMWNEARSRSQEETRIHPHDEDEEDDEALEDPTSDASLIANYHHMLLWLSVLELIDSLMYLFGHASSSSVFCYMQGLVMHWTELADTYWSSCMAMELYVIIFRSSRIASSRMYRSRHKLYALVSFVGTTVIILIGMIASHTRFDDVIHFYDFGDHAWCWISSPSIGFWTYYFHLVAYMVFVTIIYIRIIIYFYTLQSREQREGDGHRPVQKGALIRLSLYPISFLVLYLFSIIDRLEEWRTGHSAYIILALNSVFAPLPGLVNAIIFSVANKRITDTWRRACPFLCCGSSSRSRVPSSSSPPNIVPSSSSATPQHITSNAALHAPLVSSQQTGYSSHDEHVVAAGSLI